MAVRHVLSALQIPAHRRFVAVGGGTKASLWTHIVSDVTGVVQEIPQETIGAAYGDALLAAQAVGMAPDGSPWNATATLVHPQEAHVARYDELYAQYVAAYPAMREHMHQRAAWQRQGRPDAGL
jgi:xylulokinase